MTKEKKFGFAAIVGKPNAGKSTLLNTLIDYDLSITSNRPQTTRNSIRGVLTKDDFQVVFIDTPGFIKRSDKKLDQHLYRNIHDNVNSVDTIIYIIDADVMVRRKTAEEELMALEAFDDSIPVIIVMNKIDLIKDKNLLLPVTSRISEEHPKRPIFYTSALKGTEVENLLQRIAETLPVSEFCFDADTLTDIPEKFLAGEFIREKVFRLTSQEIPYHSTVRVTGWEETPKILKISAEILISKESQKAILIGKGGEKIKEIGTSARKKLEAFFMSKVFLDLRVKVSKRWQEDESILRETSFLIE